jgi:multicomponent Na+:H+ antiporter subunit D
VVALTVLGGACLAFGLAPGWVIDHVAAPAASGLLHGATYASGVLAGGAPIPPLRVAFDASDPAELATVAATVLAGLALAWAYLRAASEPAPIRVLRALHTGSVNDYAGYAVLGVLAALIALAA